jgi:hypothetical protein
MPTPAEPTITDSPSWTLATLDRHLMGVMNERDRAYQHRYEAQEKAVAAALLAQERLSQTSFASQEKAVAAALTAAQSAVNKAEVAAEKRFDSVNEFRAQLADQAATFLPRAEFDRAIGSLSEKLDASVKGLAEKIEDLRESRDTNQGHSGGLNQGWVYLVGFFSLVSLLVNVFFVLSGSKK